jgi:hypothetical protein
MGIKDTCVLFATPVKGYEVSADFHTSMLSTQAECFRHRIPCGQQIRAGHMFLALKRNELVDYFLHSDEKFTDIFFIDADQGWDEKVIPRFLSYPQDVVAGLPPKKCDEPTYHSNAMTGRIASNGLFEAHEAGTAFMRIKRSAFEKIDKAYPNLKTADRETKEVPYFQAGIIDGGFMGEDIFFCRKWQEMGESLWIDPDVTFTHRGSKSWKGNFYDHCVATGLLKKSA